MALSTYKQRPLSCEGCYLHDNKLCNSFMTAEGTGVNRIMVVAEALGANEALDGLPLRPHAQAGSVFQRALERAKLPRESFIITNMVHCQPPGNRLEGEHYEQEVIDHCSQYLRAEIERYRPQVIIALGSVPYRHLTGQSEGVTSARGYFYPGIGVAAGIPVIPTYHPAFIARGNERLMGVFIQDIVKAVKLTQGKVDRIDNIDEANRSGITRYVYDPHEIALDLWMRNLRTAQASGHIDGFALSYDIETDYTTKAARLKKSEEEYEIGGDGSKITQIQFSYSKYSAIVLPWNEKTKAFAKTLLEDPDIPKIGHNAWRFDAPKLKQEGIEIRGEHFDSMVMWHHLQPDLPADLQFVASMYDFPYPWKHRGVADPMYGAADVDALQWIFHGTMRDMRARGLYASYMEYFHNLQPILERMSARGIYIDPQERAKFKAEVTSEIARLDAEIQALVPDELKPVHPKQGYKVWPKGTKEYKCTLTNLVAGTLALGVSPENLSKMRGGTAGQVIGEFEEQTGYAFRYFPEVNDFRPCKIEPFLPQSTQHVRNMLRFFSVTVPKDLDGDETTGKGELVKLIRKLRQEAEKLEKKCAGNYPHTVTIIGVAGSDEPIKTYAGTEMSVIKRRVADILEKSLQYRECKKIDSTYIEGWPVDSNNLVHTTYTFRTATWQLSSTGPNVQNGIKRGRLSKPWLKTLTASPGRVLINADYKACHMITMAREAEDPTYERLARLDGHSFLTAHIIRPMFDSYMDGSYALIGRGVASGEVTSEEASRLRGSLEALAAWMNDLSNWLSLPDNELAIRLKLVKLFYENIRNTKAKPTLLGWQLGLGTKKLYDMNADSFRNLAEAEATKKLLINLFPKVDAWQKMIKEKAHKQTFLISRYGGIRHFWNVLRWDAKNRKYIGGEDAEKALAFLIQNHAFGKARDVMIELEETGLGEKYGFNNTIHDSMEFDCPKEFVDEALININAIMTKPSLKLAHPTLWPNGVSFPVELSVGPNKAEMKEVKL